jgi:prevent-host-death family protein
MTTASITQAKNNLSKLIKKVKHGESVLILDRNIPVARLEPLDGSEPGEDPRITELVREGVIKRGRKRLPKDFFTRPLPKLKGSLVETLLKMRAEERW